MSDRRIAALEEATSSLLAAVRDLVASQEDTNASIRILLNLYKADAPVAAEAPNAETPAPLSTKGDLCDAREP